MFAKEVYIRRREQLTKSVGSGLILLPGNGESPMNYPDNCYAFRQNSSFLYFVGLDNPDLFCILDADSGKEYLFGNELTIDDIIWMGDLPSLKEQSSSVGIDTVYPLDMLKNTISHAQCANREIHYLKPSRHLTQIQLSELLEKKVPEVLNECSISLTKEVIKLRMIKEDIEIVELEKAGEVGYEMHVLAMKLCHPRVSERKIAGRIEGLAISKGSRISFPTILSQNGQILHNHDHSSVLQQGRLMITDAGAESLSGYASDFTRTIAVGGKYSQKQIDIHQIVLKAINDSILAVRPGVTYQSIHREAYRIIFEGMKSLGLMKGDAEDALEAGAPALFMPHGLGHAMGLDVHDMEDLGESLVGYDDEIKRSTQFGYKSLRLGRRLQKGFVLTIEPGIYFIPQLIEKWKHEKIHEDFICFDKLTDYYNFGGIRLEDDVLVTDEACRPLYSKRIPITIDEIIATINS